MATGVEPRDDDMQFTRSDLDALQEAMKNKKFRELLSDYCQEVSDPANRAIYQKEMTQLEKERGYDIKFINPKGGYVIKTSVAGDQKAFINICSNENVGKPSCNVDEVDGRRGLSWQIPYSMIPPRHDYDNNKKQCVIYDVVFHPDTLRMAEANKSFRELVNKTAFDGLKKTYDIHLDDNNCRFPRSQYKGGLAQPAVIRKEDPTYKPPADEDSESLTPEVLEKLYPQKIYSETKAKPSEPPKIIKKDRGNTEYTLSSQNGYTLPKYVIKQQKSVELEEYTYHKDCKQHSAMPSQIVVEINLPLLSSTENCTLDVHEKSLVFKSEKPAKYKLDLNLPYQVNDECGNAKFDKSKHILIVTLPVIKRVNFHEHNEKSLKFDSGVESEDNSLSEEDNKKFVEELLSLPTTVSPVSSPKKAEPKEDSFLDSSLAYILPNFTHNILDDIVAFTFHVKNTDPDTVKVKKDSNKIYIKFTTVGAGFVPVHYAAIITLEENIDFDNVSGEAWDNNVILQLQLVGATPQKFHIGLDLENLKCEYFDVTDVKKVAEPEGADGEEIQMPSVEITTLGRETNILVSTSNIEYDEDDIESPTEKFKDSVFAEEPSCTGAKSILRKPMMRCHSECSYGDIASSVDYISSDCIQDESSFKKTVRFNNVIAKQFYRYNSSIEGQKKKNQRKKSKKRQLERRKSESEAEEEMSSNGLKIVKPKLKSVLKTRRDSGLADTSDAENDSKHSSPDSFNCESMENQYYNIGKRDNVCSSEDSVFNIVNNTKSEDKNDLELTETSSKMVRPNTKPVCDNNIKHNTDLYDPSNLNKGKYLEVSFKNDLIFDLDM